MTAIMPLFRQGAPVFVARNWRNFLSFLLLLLRRSIAAVGPRWLIGQMRCVDLQRRLTLGLDWGWWVGPIVSTGVCFGCRLPGAGTVIGHRGGAVLGGGWTEPERRLRTQRIGPFERPEA